MFLHKIVRNRIEIPDRIPDRFLIANPKHAQVYLLNQVRGMGFASDTATKKGVQRAAVLAKQSLDQGWVRVSQSLGA